MKKLLLTIFGCVSLVGCGSVAGIFTPVTTNTVSTAIAEKTNFVQQTAEKNGVVITQTVPEVTLVTNKITNIVTIGYTVAQAVTNDLATAQAVVSATAPVNPYAGIIEGVLGAAAAGLAWFARLKTQQAASHLSVAQTIIAGIENAEPAAAAIVKASVTSTALAQGTSTKVNNIVQAATKALSDG
jgi:hypothetical protein